MNLSYEHVQNKRRSISLFESAQIEYCQYSAHRKIPSWLRWTTLNDGRKYRSRFHQKERAIDANFETMTKGLPVFPTIPFVLSIQ